MTHARFTLEEEECLHIEKDITFKEIHDYLSRIDLLSICMLETACYENFLCLKEVPHTYDDYYVYGIGMIDSEFYKVGKNDYATSGELQDLELMKCMEIMLSREPKSVLIKRDRKELAASGLNEDCLQMEDE